MNEELEFKPNYSKMNLEHMMMMMELVDFRLMFGDRQLTKRDNFLLNNLLKDDALTPVIECRSELKKSTVK